MSERTALITGASRGIGRELSILFADDGYDVVLVARGEPDLAELSETLTGRYGVDAEYITQNLARPEAGRTLYETLQDRAITIDFLVNNAGFGAHGRLAEMDPSTISDMLQLNVVCLTQLTRQLLGGMLDRKYGKILNVASTAGFQPGPLMAVYYASKAYVLSFSDALVEELRGTPVTVTTLAPGPTATDFQKRAGLSNTLIGPGSPSMQDAATVASRGYSGLMDGKSLVVPGTMNKIHRQLLRIAPRAMVRRAVHRVNSKR